MLSQKGKAPIVSYRTVHLRSGVSSNATEFILKNHTIKL